MAVSLGNYYQHRYKYTGCTISNISFIYSFCLQWVSGMRCAVWCLQCNVCSVMSAVWCLQCDVPQSPHSSQVEMVARLWRDSLLASTTQLLTYFSAPRENLVGEMDLDEERPELIFLLLLAPYELWDSWFLKSPLVLPDSLESARSSEKAVPVKEPKQLSLSVLELLTFLEV